MAKKKNKVNKTQTIKDALADDPKASPKELAESLTKGGVKVSAAYVSTVKSSLKKKKGGRRKKAAATDSLDASVLALVQAKKLAEQLGGIDRAKDALSALAKLQ